METTPRRYLKNALLIDGTGAAPRPHSGLLLRGDTIERVVPPEEASLVPPEAEVLDLQGKTLMPGLIDVHVHLFFPRRLPDGRDAVLWEHLEKSAIRCAVNARTLLYAGYTTIRDVGCRERVAMGVRDAINAGLVEGPRVVASGPVLNSTSGMMDRFPSWAEVRNGAYWLVDGVDEVCKATRTLLKDGADNIKLEASGGEASPYCMSWNATMSYEEIAVAVREATKAGKTVAAHAQANEGIRNAVRAGVTTVEHATYLDRDTALAMKEQGIFAVPTIACLISWLELGLASGAPPEVVEEMKINKEPWLRSIRMAAELGVKLANGSDLGNRYPQGTQARELELMVRHIGLSPMEALVSATKTSAEALRLGDKLGTLEAGKLADLLVVDGDPTENITLLQDPDRIQMIMRNGVAYKNALENRA